MSVSIRTLIPTPELLMEYIGKTEELTHRQPSARVLSIVMCKPEPLHLQEVGSVGWGELADYFNVRQDELLSFSYMLGRLVVGETRETNLWFEENVVWLSADETR